MPVCVPIRDLKNTAEFSKTVEDAAEPVIVTRNGREVFAVMTVEQLDALRMEAARAELYQRAIAAEQDIAEGRLADARASQRAVRERHGL